MFWVADLGDPAGGRVCLVRLGRDPNIGILISERGRECGCYVWEIKYEYKEGGLTPISPLFPPQGSPHLQGHCSYFVQQGAAEHPLALNPTLF